MPELLITLADGRSQRHTLGDRPEEIGRDATCEIPIDDASASRRHARFVPAQGGYTVEDLGSKNGTLVNNVPCTTKALREGDSVQVGSTVAVYYATSASQAGSVQIRDDVTSSHATRYVSRDQRLLLSQHRLELIYELTERLTTLQSQEKLLENAMDICFDTLQFERGAIAVKRPDSRAVDWPVVRNLRGREGELTISRSLLNRAMERGERAIFVDGGMGDADPTVSMVQQGIRSAMCVPLMRNEETLGVIYGDRTSTSAKYNDEDIDFLAGIAQQVSVGLINCRLLEEQKRMFQLQRDLDLARTIQTGLFPQDLPNEAGLTVSAINDPGQLVSGDYYDVIPTADGRIWCLMADVTGEGVAAAMLMANLQAAVRVTAQDTDDPSALFARWNNLVWRNTDPSKFITALLALIDPKTHEVRFASAGHHLPYILRKGADALMELDGNPGFPLGIVEDAEFELTTIDLGPDPFTYFCYTDGVIEAMNTEQELFGAGRLETALAEHTASAPRILIKKLRQEVASFAGGAAQSDDLTMLAASVE